MGGCRRRCFIGDSARVSARAQPMTRAASPITFAFFGFILYRPSFFPLAPTHPPTSYGGSRFPIRIFARRQGENAEACVYVSMCNGEAVYTRNAPSHFYVTAPCYRGCLFCLPGPRVALFQPSPRPSPNDYGGVVTRVNCICARFDFYFPR